MPAKFPTICRDTEGLRGCGSCLARSLSVAEIGSKNRLAPFQRMPRCGRDGSATELVRDQLRIEPAGPQEPRGELLQLLSRFACGRHEVELGEGLEEALAPLEDSIPPPPGLTRLAARRCLRRQILWIATILKNACPHAPA